jgi:hypothetical protein
VKLFHSLKNLNEGRTLEKTLEERAKDRDDGQTHWRKASHLLFPNSKKRHRIGIDNRRFCCAQLP